MSEPLQELEVVGDELHDPTVISEEDIAKASAVLSQLAAAIESWKKGIATNDNPQKLAELIAEATRLHSPVDKMAGWSGEKGQIGPASQVLRQIGEKALDLTQRLQTDPATVDLSNEMAALIGLMNSLAGRYPRPDIRVSSKYPNPLKKGDLEMALMGVAEKSLATSHKIISTKAVTKDIHAQVETMVYDLSELAKAIGITKNDVSPTLPPISDVGDYDEAHAAAMNDVLKQVTDRATSLAKMAGDNPSDAVKTEIGALHDLVKAAKERCPMQTQKAGGTFAKTLREVSERALSLSSKAKTGGFEGIKAMREIKGLVTLLQGLTEKYPNVKKADEVEISDFGLLLDADRRLDDVSDELAKAESDKDKEAKDKELEAEKARKAKEAELEEEKKRKAAEDAKLEEEKKRKAKEEEMKKDDAPGEDPKLCKACKAEHGGGNFCKNCGAPVTKSAPFTPEGEQKGTTGQTGKPATTVPGSQNIVAPEQTGKPTSPTQTAPMVHGGTKKADEIAELTKRLEAALATVNELQVAVTKARNDVTPPASTGSDPDPDQDTLLFPENYNDPAYREALAKRESA